MNGLFSAATNYRLESLLYSYLEKGIKDYVSRVSRQTVRDGGGTTDCKAAIVCAPYKAIWAEVMEAMAFLSCH